MGNISKEKKKILAKQIAYYVANNVPLSEIATKLTMSPNTVKKYMHSKEVHKELESIGLEFNTFKFRLREEVTKRLSKIVETLDHHLENKNLKAIEQVVKIMQLDKLETEQKDTSITVNLDLGTTKQPISIGGESHEVQDGQRTEGVSTAIGNESKSAKASDDAGVVYSTQLSEDDLPYISEEISGGTD